MGLLSDFIKGYAKFAREWIDFITNPVGYAIDQATGGAATEAEEQANQQIDRFFGEFFDAVEDDVVEEILAQGEITPENVEARINTAEGAALEDALAAIFGLYGIETVSAGQLESGQFMVTQIMSFLALQEVLGRRTGMAYEKGVDPALEAEVAKQTRAEFVSLQDAVEFLTRNKTGDSGYLRGENVDPDAASVIGSNEPVNPENLVEEWGIRDDNLEVLEEVGIKVLEAEELLETPVEFGVIPDRDVVERELDRNSLSEDTKQLFLDVVDSIPRATTAWEERTRYEELINLLDEAADQGELDPDSVRSLFPDLDDRVVEELVERFRLIEAVPNKAPTRSQVDGSFAWGLTDVDTLEARYDQVDVDPEKYPDVIDAGILDEIDGDLQQAFALGNLTAGEYGQLMDRVGLPTDAQTTLTAGGDLGDYTERVLQEEAEPEDQPVETVSGIGDARGAGLRAVGIETVADLATADVEVVVEAAQVAEETAQGYIDQAALRTT